MTNDDQFRRSGRWGLHHVYTKRFHSWRGLEKEVAALPTTKEKGDSFEQFSYFYFLYHKDLYGIKEVWSDKIKDRAIPKNIRQQYKLEKKDFGVDGASMLISGSLEAWQGKFRSDGSSPTYTELSTFWTEAEHADFRRIIANSGSLPPIAAKKKGHQQTLVDSFLELGESFFDALFSFATEKAGIFTIERHKPRPHQVKIIEEVVSGLLRIDRGKLIAAPGTGKTLTALWIVENDDLDLRSVLVLVPSIALVGQTLREWSMHRNERFVHLCVCSDETVDKGVKEDLERYDISTSELGFPVTTSEGEIQQWISDNLKKRHYIFCTYHSVETVEAAIKKIRGYRFDLILFDEAHRTVGHGDQQFGIALHDDRIPAKKRLFMTATEKILSPQLRTLAEKAGIIVFSMSDEAIYGPILYEYKFGDAIKDGVIADYEIVLAEVSGQAEKDLIEINRLLRIEPREQGEPAIEISADQLFKAGFLIKAILQKEISKVVTFHNYCYRAIAFNRALSHLSRGMAFPDQRSMHLSYVLGDQKSAERSEKISEFERASIGILSNVQVLSEGVNIPLIDSVYFVDPKASVIEIVQAAGRALRKPYGPSKKIARIIVPIIVPQEAKTLEDVDWDDTLETLHYVIQAMRAQDMRLEEEVNQINLYGASEGRKGYRVGGGKKIKIVAPGLAFHETIDPKDFIDKITLRIASANANPEGTKTGFSFLGKGERKSEFKPTFGILGDFNPDVYRDSLVIPTVSRFRSVTATVDRESLVITHNNVSHTVRLGVIKELKNDKMRLTHLGQMLYQHTIDFENLFKNQMMLYTVDNKLYSYRLVVQLLLELKTLNHIEFLYGPYVCQGDSDVFDLAGAKKRIKDIRSEFPSIQLTSVANREVVRARLNEISNIDIPDKDVWGDRSTPKNKFRYLKNALKLFEFIENDDSDYKIPIKLSIGSAKTARKILALSDPSKAPVDDYYGEWFWIEDK